ncbi:MAG: FHA domain-containing protein, partial [Acidobacteria bacterium]|nr:FHA domain-containing protein [Acidobacteriota bacterium]
THRVTVRIGLNHGLGFVKSNDVFGDVVNVASRVEGSANAEQILVSSNIHDALAPTNRFRFRHAGRFPLKGKTDASDLFEVIWQEPSGPALPESVAAGPQTKLRIVQLCKDATGRTFEIASKVTVIGRTAGEFTFPDDEYMQPTHARLLMESGQLFLQPMPSADSYFSLVASYRLQPGDVVSIGRQVLEFQENQAALAEASQIGKGLGELAAMLHNAVAEFISLKSDAKRYPVREQQTTFGRTKATFTFPTDTVMSRSHARVYHRGEDFFLEDLGSTNGTFVLARDKTPIPPGTVLSIGGQRLKIVREEERG